MRLLKLLLVLLVWAAAVPAVAGPFEDGADAYRTGRLRDGAAPVASAC